MWQQLVQTLSDIVSSSPGCFLLGEELKLLLPEVPEEGETAPAEERRLRRRTSSALWDGSFW